MIRHEMVILKVPLVSSKDTWKYNCCNEAETPRTLPNARASECIACGLFSLVVTLSLFMLS